MKALIKIIVLIATVVAVLSLLRSSDGSAIRGIKGWAERTVSHIESLASQKEEIDYESKEPFPEQYYDADINVFSENTYSSGGATITSEVGLSSGSDREEDPTSGLRGNLAESEEDTRSKPEKIEWVKQVTERYAQTSWHLLMLYDALPSSQEVESDDDMVMSTRKTAPTFAYLRGSSATEILHSMGTNVHEIAHGYCSQYVFKHAKSNGLRMSWDNVYVAYYLSPDKTYIVTFPKESLFPSAEIVPDIPRNLRTFRFDTYVDGNTSTQGEGVLGLLDEFHAYYQGSQCSYDLLDAYVLAEASAVRGFHQWMNSLQSNITAFWEFDFFIKEYLLHMRSQYPDDYALLISRGEFTDAYKGIRKVYSELIEDYEARVVANARRLDASGEADVTVEDGIVWITYPGSRHRDGVQIFGDAKGILEPVLQSRRFDKITGDQ